MDAQDIRNLQEAYLEVYQLDEGERVFPYGKVGNKLRSLSNKKKEAKSPEEKNRIDARLRKINKEYNVPMEQVDLYDIILSHLLDEGYAETQEAAEAIMVSMSEEWREEILSEMPYQIYGPATHGPSDSEPVKIGKPYKDKKRAKRRADKLDQEIGGYRHSVRKVDEEQKLDEVKGFGGHVDPHTGKSTGKRSQSQQAHSQYWDNKRSGNNQPDPRRSKFKYGGSSSATTGAQVGEPPEHFAKKQNPDLAMTPAARMKARARSLELRGKGKQANKIRSVASRPDMS